MYFNFIGSCNESRCKLTIYHVQNIIMQLANDTCLNTQNRAIENVSRDNIFFITYCLSLYYSKEYSVLFFIVESYQPFLRHYNIVYLYIQSIISISQYIVNKSSYVSSLFTYINITGLLKTMLNKASLAIKYLLFVFNLIIFVSLLLLLISNVFDAYQLKVYIGIV